MIFEKTMCDRLGYKYRDIFGHLEFILNKMNMVLNNYGNGLSDEELKMLNELFLKLEKGQIEIIEFTKPIEKHFDIDEIYKENKSLKAEVDLLNDNRHFLNNKIEEAIEYIKGNCFLLKSGNYTDLDKDDVVEVIKILEKGEENE